MERSMLCAHFSSVCYLVGSSQTTSHFVHGEGLFAGGMLAFSS